MSQIESETFLNRIYYEKTYGYWKKSCPFASEVLRVFLSGGSDSANQILRELKIFGMPDDWPMLVKFPTDELIEEVLSRKNVLPPENTLLMLFALHTGYWLSFLDPFED